MTPKDTSTSPDLSLKKSSPSHQELHAHLTGSLSDATVLKLLRAKQAEGGAKLPQSAEVTIQRGHKRTLEECFEVFRILHCLTDNLSAIKTITRDVIQEFVADNVHYLELRTTPKSIDGVMTKNQYIDTVLEAMIDEMKMNNITVRLLVSIDRSRGLDDAWDTLQLAKQYAAHDQFKSLICGIDVSGNPRAGNLGDYIPVLQEAKQCGLNLSVHLAEVPNEKETLELLKTGLIDRIGHGTFIHPDTGGSQELSQLVKSQAIPLELCLSSNIKSGTVKSAEDHHFSFWRKDEHPVVICTDDKGVFSTTLSEEYKICAETFHLKKADLRELCLAAVELTFLSQEEKERLRLSVHTELDELTRLES
ncbi:adenosine deaminase-like protein [Penaeus japonicus]|uniref:adenosine deaminase-like protein n=1 Tax=Penaeus japonicus TaxID=27405 RepID=UPI001C70BF19|nr:adenosine deaminase-like protein [Penaeus japonicus]